MSALLEQVEAALGRLTAGRGTGVIAVSGGPDSVALLRTAWECLGPPRLTVAHINHQLRGPDSDADEQFVRELAERLSLDCRVAKFDTAGEAHHNKDNLEQTARRQRYEWLTEVARDVGAGWVATGHTADDQAETVLFRLMRGTGLRGLRGIPEDRELCPGVRLVRPMLSLGRAEVLSYLAAVGQPFREDRSNTDVRFSRNRIRHELLPVMKSFNPQLVRVLGDLAGQAEAAFDIVEATARQLLAAAELPREDGAMILDVVRLREAPRHLVREVLAELWRREDWPTSRMTYADWDRAAGLVFGEGHATDLPGRVRVRRRQKRLIIVRLD